MGCRLAARGVYPALAASNGPSKIVKILGFGFDFNDRYVYFLDLMLMNGMISRRE
jgi:hypothetical protein